MIVEIVDIEDIEGIFHKDFAILVTNFLAKISKALGHSNYFAKIVKMVEDLNLELYLAMDSTKLF